MGGTSGEDIEGKTVVFGITGGIAAYKAPLIVRGLKRLGLDVYVVMTEAAQHFVTPLVLQALSGRMVNTDMFAVGPGASYEIDHIALADKADLFLIAPAPLRLDDSTRVAGMHCPNR